ncbi:MAG: MerR family transcriptional regulator [Planctomycetota bacterium]|nr:MAG: MerR family transcriptional regulator [Planctomycetota bacterium]
MNGKIHGLWKSLFDSHIVRVPKRSIIDVLTIAQDPGEGREKETDMASTGACRGKDVARTERSARKPRKLWRVGELVRHTGLSRQTLHNWCQLGLICEAERTEGGHRLYDDSVFARLERIQRARAQGKSLREIADAFARQQRRQQATKGGSGE